MESAPEEKELVEDIVESSDEDSDSDGVDEKLGHFKFEHYGSQGQYLKELLDPLNLSCSNELKIAGVILAKESHKIDEKYFPLVQSITLDTKFASSQRARGLKRLVANRELYFETLVKLFEKNPNWIALFDYSFAKKKVWRTFSYLHLEKIISVATDPQFHKSFSEWLRKVEDKDILDRRLDLWLSIAKSKNGCPTALYWAAFEEYQINGELIKSLPLSIKYLLGEFEFNSKVDWLKFVTVPNCFLLTY
jgi:hypothetical protein